MKPRDVVFVLQHFPFRQRRNADQRIAIEIDKGIRDYLIYRIHSMRGRQGASSKFIVCSPTKKGRRALARRPVTIYFISVAASTP